MEPLFRAGQIQVTKYRVLRLQAQHASRNQISSSNELRGLFSGTGATHQITSKKLTLDDAVLAIAAVVLGVSQIKYPYRIALGNLDLYRSLGSPNLHGKILPEIFDAFLSPIDLDIIDGDSKKRKLEDTSESSDEAHRKRHKSSGTISRPVEPQDFALAVLEMDNTHFQRFEVDIAAVRERPTPAMLSADSHRIVSQVKSAIRSSSRHGPAMTLGSYARHIARPYAPERYEIHAAILHAWAYILDLPLNPRPEHSMEQFDNELLDLINIALQGRLTYPLLKEFLYTTGYLYPAEAAEDLEPFQCIERKYRKSLRRFRSVEIRKNTEDAGAQETDIATLSTSKRVPLSDVRNAIGSLWRATLRQEFCQTVLQRFSFGTEHNIMYGPHNTPLLLLHIYGHGGKQFVYLATAAMRSREVVRITHYGVDRRQTSGSNLKRFTERSVRQCGWHGAEDVTNVHFEHIFAPSAIPNNARQSALYAIFFAWCLLLGVEIASSNPRITPDSAWEAAFLSGAQAIINSAFAGTATVAAIKSFLTEYGFANGFKSRSIDRQLVTRIQPASWDALKAFIQKKRARQAKSPTHPDTPSLIDPLLESPVRTSHTKVSRATSQPTGSSSIQLEEGQAQAEDAKTAGETKERLVQAAPLPKPQTPQAAPPKSTTPKTPSPQTHDTEDPLTQTHAPETASPRRNWGAAAFLKAATPKTPTSQRISTEQSPKAPEESITLKPRRSSRSKTPVEPSVTKSASKSSPSSEHSISSKPKEQRSPRQTPPATVLPWGEYRNPEKYHMYDTSECDSDTWMREFLLQLQRCRSIRETLRAADPDVPERRFTDENGTMPIYGAQRTIVGDLIASLWKPLWDRTIKFGLVDINYVRMLQDKELSWNGIPPAAGGPYPYIMAMHGTSVDPSPDPGDLVAHLDDMGHIWLAVAQVREADLLDQDGEPTLRESTDSHPIHVDISVYDTQPGTVLEEKKHGKPRGLVRYSGWAVGSIEGKDNHGAVSLLPRHWEPTIEITDVACPNQYSDRATKRVNACGLLTTLHAWMIMLDLPITRKRGNKHAAPDFYAHLIQLFDLALAGALTTRTIQAFVNAFHYIAVVQDLKETVVDAQTEDPQLASQLMEQLVEDATFYTNAP